MEAEEKDVKKRRRRSIRNLRRRSGIVPFDIDFQLEESHGEKEKADNVKPGNPNEEDLFGSLWMETNEPVLKKKKRRSSLFMSAPHQANITESQLKQEESDIVSNGNVSPATAPSPNVHVPKTKSEYIQSPRLSSRGRCSEELMLENMPAVDGNQGILQTVPMTESDIGCCQSTFNAGSDVTPANSVPSISTPSSMSPEYADSPTEHLYGNSHEESYLTSCTIDNKEHLQHTVCDFDQSFVAISNKENVNLKSTVPFENSLNATETDSHVTSDSRGIKEVEKDANSSPGILSISKAIGKVVDFVKTSPSYIFGNTNGNMTDQQTASPVLKVNTDKNVISLSTSGKSNELSFSENHRTGSVYDRGQTVETQPQEKMDIFLDTYNAIMKVFQKAPVDKDKDSKVVELNRDTITNCHEETLIADRSLMEVAELAAPNYKIPSVIVQNNDQGIRENTTNNTAVIVNDLDSTSSMCEINHKRDNEIPSETFQNHDQVARENTTDNTSIIANDFDSTNNISGINDKKDNLNKTIITKKTGEQNCEGNNTDLNNSTYTSEITCGQDNDVMASVSTENNENTRITDINVDCFLDTSLDKRNYENNTDVDNNTTVNITEHGDSHCISATVINSPLLDKPIPEIISRSETIQKYKRRSKDCISLKSQLPLTNEDVSYTKNDSEIDNFSKKGAMHSPSDIKAICRKYSRKGRRSADHTTMILDLQTVLEDIDVVKTTHTSNSVDNVESVCIDNSANSKECSGLTLESEMCAVQTETSLQPHDGKHKNAETTENESYTNTNMVTHDNLVTQTELVQKRRGRSTKKPVFKTEVNEVIIGTEISNTKVVEDETVTDDDSAKVTKRRRQSRRSLDNNTLMAEVKCFRENPDKECLEDVGTNNSAESQLESKNMLRKRRKSSGKSSLETVFEQELAESGDGAKTPKFSKKRKTNDDADIEKIYRNKNFIKPEQHKPWQTIFESPDKFGETLGKKRMQRFINFEMPSQMKLRRRLQKATKNGWNPTSKKRTVLNDQEVKDKLNSLWLDLDSCNTETETLQDKLRAIVHTE